MTILFQHFWLTIYCFVQLQTLLDCLFLFA
jgi:hypothetical protein